MRIKSLVVAAACGMIAASSGAAQSREVRVLGADDPNLLPVLRAGARGLFNATTFNVGFNGVYINKEKHAQLTTEIMTIARAGGTRQGNAPSSCTEVVGPIQMNPPAPPTDPATGRSGAPPPAPVRYTDPSCTNSRPSSGTTYYSFHTVRIASDSAYLEVRANNVTHCMVLTVADSSGWRARTFKRGKAGQCGK